MEYQKSLYFRLSAFHEQLDFWRIGESRWVSFLTLKGFIFHILIYTPSFLSYPMETPTNLRWSPGTTRGKDLISSMLFLLAYNYSGFHITEIIIGFFFRLLSKAPRREL